MSGERASSSRTARTVTRAASSSGKPPTPVPIAGKAMLDARRSRARAIALRTARSMISAFVRRSRSSETAWMTARAASRPAGVTIASPSGTGAWRTAANSIASPPARLISPATPVDIHSDRLAAFTIASTSRSQMSPFQSSIRAKGAPLGTRGRDPVRPAGASYTRARRADIAVTTSHEFVVRHRATSAAVISAPPWRPIRTTSSSSRPGAPGTSLTSIIVASIATLPTTGTRTPRTRTSARFESERGQPSP